MKVHNVYFEYQLHIYTVGMGTVYQPESASDDPSTMPTELCTTKLVNKE